MRRQQEGKPAFVVHFLIVNEAGVVVGRGVPRAACQCWQDGPMAKRGRGREGVRGVFNEGDP